jgi:polysaccharide biosynthesis protein PslH
MALATSWTPTLDAMWRPLAWPASPAAPPCKSPLASAVTLVAVTICAILSQPVRVLLVLPFPLLSEGGAGAKCAIGTARGLTARGVEYRILSADGRRRREPGPPGDLPIEAVPVAIPGGARARFEHVIRPRTLLCRPPFSERMRTLAKEADIVHLVGLDAGSATSLLDHPALTQLDCSTLRDDRTWNPLRREGRISIELLRAERRVCRRSQWLLASSSEVGRSLAASAPRAQVVAAPLALDPVYYSEQAPLERPVVGLLGSASWPPTRHAVERLITRVWPLVTQARPGTRLLLAGRGMERATFSNLPDLPGVEWRGAVPSATEFLRELGVLLYPLTAGSGVKVKVLEALALGIPVVTTPAGAEGLGSREGVTVETDDSRLAASVVALCEDREARRAAGSAGRQTFLRHHSPLPATAPLVELYERIIEAGMPRRAG